MKFQILCVVWAILLLASDVSLQTPVCHCNRSSNVIGGSNVTIFQQHVFRAFCFTNDVMCIMTSFIIPSPSILNIWRHGGLTALTLLFTGFVGPWEKHLHFSLNSTLLKWDFPFFFLRGGGGGSIVLLTLSNVYIFFLSISNQVNQIFWKGCGRYQSTIKSGGLILAWDTTTAMYPQLS